MTQTSDPSQRRAAALRRERRSIWNTGLFGAVAAVAAIAIAYVGETDRREARTNDTADAHVGAIPLTVLGERVFSNRCASCHGVEGRGGIANPNSILGTVPALDRLAERMMLFDEEDAALVVRQLDKGSLRAMSSTPFRSYSQTVTQYGVLRAFLRKGNPSGIANASAPKPPFDMPAWRGLLSEREINAVISYLIERFPWDQDEAEDDEGDWEDDGETDEEM